MLSKYDNPQKHAEDLLLLAEAHVESGRRNDEISKVEKGLQFFTHILSLNPINNELTDTVKAE